MKATPPGRRTPENLVERRAVLESHVGGRRLRATGTLRRPRSLGPDAKAECGGDGRGEAPLHSWEVPWRQLRPRSRKVVPFRLGPICATLRTRSDRETAHGAGKAEKVVDREHGPGTGEGRG